MQYHKDLCKVEMFTALVWEPDLFSYECVNSLLHCYP